MKKDYKLSICIQTFNRHETLVELVNSLKKTPGIEILIADFSTQDEIIRKNKEHLKKFDYIKYLVAKNAGLDFGFDYLVKCASGEFCWLLPDDDIVVHGAIPEILKALTLDPVDFLILNTRVVTKSRSVCLRQKLFELENDYEKIYEESFLKVAPSLSYVGSCVVRRQLWLQFSDIQYLNSYFMHVYIFAKIIDAQKTIYAVDKVAIEVRANNAIWTAQAFKIWTENWPAAIHSIKSLDNALLTEVVKRPAHDVFKNIVYYFAYGALSRENINQYNFRKINLFSTKILLLFGRHLVAVGVIAYLLFKYKSFSNEPVYYLIGRMKGKFSSMIYKYFFNESR